jgi:hypothetical protein
MKGRGKNLMSPDDMFTPTLSLPHNMGRELLDKYF